MTSVPILTYHEISTRSYPTYRRFTVTPDEFRRQMRWLAAKGYSSISLDTLHAYREGTGTLPRKPMVLTFDDGCRECVEHATGILSAFGFTGMFYLVSGFMGATTTWMKDRREIELPIIDWKVAQQLAAGGFACGSHTVTHPRLTEVSPSQCREELTRSKRELEDRLGCAIVHFSYPYGCFDERVREMAGEAGYRTAVTVQPGLSGGSHDPLALRRITVAGEESFQDFTFRVRTGKRVDELLPKPVYAAASRVKRLFAGRRAGIS